MGLAMSERVFLNLVILAGISAVLGFAVGTFILRILRLRTWAAFALPTVIFGTAMFLLGSWVSHGYFGEIVWRFVLPPGLATACGGGIGGALSILIAPKTPP